MKPAAGVARCAASTSPRPGAAASDGSSRTARSGGRVLPTSDRASTVVRAPRYSRSTPTIARARQRASGLAARRRRRSTRARARQPRRACSSARCRSAVRARSPTVAAALGERGAASARCAGLRDERAAAAERSPPRTSPSAREASPSRRWRRRAARASLQAAPSPPSVEPTPWRPRRRRPRRRRGAERAARGRRPRARRPSTIAEIAARVRASPLATFARDGVPAPLDRAL